MGGAFGRGALGVFSVNAFLIPKGIEAFLTFRRVARVAFEAIDEGRFFDLFGCCELFSHDQFPF